MHETVGSRKASARCSRQVSGKQRKVKQSKRPELLGFQKERGEAQAILDWKEKDGEARCTEARRQLGIRKKYQFVLGGLSILNNSQGHQSSRWSDKSNTLYLFHFSPLWRILICYRAQWCDCISMIPRSLSHSSILQVVLVVVVFQHRVCTSGCKTRRNSSGG